MTVTPDATPPAPSRVPGVRRFLARFLVLMCCPLVAFAQADAASAAVAYGAAARWSVSQDQKEAQGIEMGFGEGWEVACSGSGAYKVEDGRYSVVGKVLCDVDVWLWNDPGPGDLTDPTITIRYNGTVEGTQTACTYNTAPITGEFLSTQDYETVTATTRCVATEVCLEAFVRDPGNMARHDFYMLDNACASADLGPLPKPPSSCLYGTPTAVMPSMRAGEGPTYEGKWGQLMTIRITSVPPGNEYAAPGTQWHHWRYIARYGTTVPDLTTAGVWRQANTDTSNNAEGWNGDTWKSRQTVGSGTLSTDSRLPFGVWLYVTAEDKISKPANLMKGVGAGNSSGTAYNSVSDWGKNDPGNCIFYFGPKFFDDPLTDLDDPQGTLTGEPVDPGSEEPPNLDPEEPVTEGDQCDFSFTDPTSWLTAGICKLVELIRELIEKVKELPKAIANAFVDLFKPTEGMGPRVNRIKAAFADVFPFNLGDRVESMSAGGGGGCPSWEVRVLGESWSAVCDSSFTTAVRGARPFLLAGMLAVAFWPLVRGIFYAAVPLVKPTPSGGEK